VSTVNELLLDIALNVGDPMLERIKESHVLGFINRAARDLINAGWLLPQAHAENIELRSDEWEYDVPALFAYIEEIRLGDKTVGTAATIATGVLLDGAIADTTTTLATVDDSSIFAVNDLIQIDTEIMLVTAVPTATTLTITRGYYSTTAASHLDDASVLRPHADTIFDYVIPRPYWRIKTQTGGANTTTAALASRPQFVFHSRFFSFTAGTPLQIVGQRRPNTYTSGLTTIDAHMESFIVERATAYAARFLFAAGDHQHLDIVYRESMATSDAFFGYHPAEFRVKPSSTRVPGR